MLFVAEAHQPARQVVALRRGEEELGAGERGGPREIEARRVTGVAAVLPVDVPAGLELELEPELDLSFGLSRAGTSGTGRNQAHARLRVRDPGPTASRHPAGVRSCGDRRRPDERQAQSGEYRRDDPCRAKSHRLHVHSYVKGRPKVGAVAHFSSPSLRGV